MLSYHVFYIFSLKNNDLLLRNFMNGFCSAFHVISKEPIVTVIVNCQREGPRFAQKDMKNAILKYNDSSILFFFF